MSISSHFLFLLSCSVVGLVVIQAGLIRPTCTNIPWITPSPVTVVKRRLSSSVFSYYDWTADVSRSLQQRT